jgi:predicted KAP-like P-loop ATPase
MWNDKETSVDLLGHDKIAKTILEIIGDSHLRPLTIGVYGDWGVGKSSILSILQETVEAERRAKVSNSYCIMFNGWLFQGYEDAKTALMESVVTELAALQPNLEKVKTLAKSLLKRINWLKVAKVATGAALTGLTGLPLGGITNEVFERIKKMTEVGEDEKILKEKGEEETVTSQIHAFRKEFKELIESSKVDHVIILVDDLDRCLPKSVIEILEAIRLFLFVEGTTFVISADERMIEYAVREHFPNLPSSYADYTRSYLEKLIQIPIRIPTLTKLQTGNYIRLLMLQFFLKHDYGKLKEVYEAFNKKKKRPYDPIELSYESIPDDIKSSSPDLKETMFVAGQITPTLSAGLKGNPRNIKRFLNTLFLRLRISKIYGLDDVVKLNVLAKLMLLERFHTEHYNRVVDEVSASAEGKSKTIKDAEQASAVKSAQAGIAATQHPGATTKDQELVEWAKIDPPLGDTDLRPYIYISKEKAIGFDADSAFPEHLMEFHTQLTSGSEMMLNKAEKALGNITLKEKTMLFEKLESESRAIADLGKIPPPIQGLLRIIHAEPSLEYRFLVLIESYPSAGLGPWAISQLSGLKTPEGLSHFKKIKEQWGTQTENGTLAALAKQKLN